jgi:DNA-directed RNA polymerase specialized sigma24 family protein
LNQVDYIKGIQQNDPIILKLIYSNYSDRIKNYILTKGGTIDDAKDIFQDALIIIYNKSLQPDFELTSQFYTYLFGICNNLWQRKKQKKSNNTVTIPDDNGYISGQSIEKDILRQERFNLYERNLQKMGVFCKELLVAFFRGESMTKLTEMFDLKNEHTTRNRKYRCQKKLEKLIKDDQQFPELNQK